jgi:hypothetical protein
MRRELAKPPTLDQATLEGTVVQVTGTVRAVDELLIAPLSGKSCVLYRSLLTLLGVPDSPLARTDGNSRFVIETEDGPVLVDSQHAVLDIAPVRGLKVTKARREQFRLRRGARGDSQLNGFKEYVVAPGDMVSVVGVMMLDPATEPPSAESGFRDDPPPERRLTGNAEHPIIVGKVG